MSDRSNSDSPKRRSRLLPAILGVAVAALITGLVTPFGEQLAKRVLGKDSCEPVKIDSPRENLAVRGAEGVRIAGIACGLSGRTVWVFDRDSADGQYWLVGDGDAVTATDGTWEVLDKPIGSEGDQGKQYQIIVVLANAVCDDALRVATPDDKDGQLVGSLPKECVVVAQIPVLVTY